MTTRVRPTDDTHLRPRRVDQSLTFGARPVRAERLSLNLYGLEDDTAYREDVLQTTYKDDSVRKWGQV